MSTTADQTTMRPSPFQRLRQRDFAAAALAFVIGLFAIAGAWGSQVFGGLVPCELCLEQRLAYYWGLPVLALVLVFWDRLPKWLWYVGISVAAAVFAWGLYVAGYHAGVELGFWPGPTACTGAGVDINFGDLQHINESRVVPCDKVQFRFLGVTLAGYNVLVQLGIVLLLGFAIARRR